MAIAAHENGGNHEVADGRGRIDRRRGAALGALQSGEGDIADGDAPAHPGEFREGGNAVDVDVGAEADRVDGDPGLLLQGANAGEIDDGEEARAGIHEAEARRALEDPGFSAQFLREEDAEKVLDGCAPFRGRQVAAGHLDVVCDDGQGVPCVVVAGPQLRQRGLAGEHEELLLRLVFRIGSVKARRPVLDGEHPVAGEMPTSLEARLVQRFGGEALHRVAVEGGDTGGGEGCFGHALRCRKVAAGVKPAGARAMVTVRPDTRGRARTGPFDVAQKVSAMALLTAA